MRIFFPSAADFLSDWQPNGEGLIAWNLLTSLAARGHEVVACVTDHSLRRDPPFEVVKLRYRTRLESLDPLARARAAMLELQRRGPARFDVVHWLFPDGAVGLRSPMLPRIPLVVGPLVLPWPASRPWWPAGFVVSRAIRPWFEWEQRRLLARSDCVLIAYDDVRQRITGGHPRRIVEMPFGIALDGTEPASLPLQPRVFYAGRLEQIKGIFDLVDAARIVADRLPAAQFVLAGSGPLEHELSRRVEQLGLAGSVRLLGSIGPGEVASQMEHSSVVCVPSYGEPFGMVILEAMRAGRAVVSTDQGGPRSIVVEGKGGRLVRPGEPVSLARALLDVLTDRDWLNSAGRFNRSLVGKKYGLQTITSQLEDVYRDVCNDGVVRR